MLISIPIIKSEIAFYTTDDGDAEANGVVVAATVT